MTSTTKLTEYILNDQEQIIDLIDKKSAKNLSVYKNNYISSLVDSLAQKYKCIKISLGEQNFKYFSFRYISDNPSKSANLNEYAEDFPEYLETCLELKDFTHLVSLARIDLFWFKMKKNEELYLEKGVLSLWKSIVDDEDSSPTVSLEQKSRVYFRAQNNEMFLVQDS